MSHRPLKGLYLNTRFEVTPKKFWQCLNANAIFGNTHKQLHKLVLGDSVSL